MADEVLVESKRHLVTLTDLQAARLRAVGQQLASSKTFWGDAAETDEPGEVQPTRTVVHCVQVRKETYEVTVNEAVGIIALPDLQLIVQPKIPVSHFHYLMRHSSAFPRVAEDPAHAAEATVLWDLVASWYLTAVERLLRQGLLSDYEEHSDLLPAVRGSIRTQETALAFYQGSTLIACDYDEFSPDTALNRILRAAALSVAYAPFLDDELRKRARRVLARLDEPGDLRRTDLRTALDRRTARYEAPLVLARHVLAATGRTFSSGQQRAQTFLIRTPDLVEDAIRRILQQGLTGQAIVSKKGRQLIGSKLTLNPDLVFGSIAVGDVKYKLLGKDWKRSDLYQAVAFATGYWVNHAAIVTFAPVPNQTPAPVQVGDVNLTAITWDCSTAANPGESAQATVEHVAKWLTEAVASSSGKV